MSNSSIWPMDRTLSSSMTPGLNGPGSDGNEGILRIPQSFSITEVSPSDCLVYSLGESYLSVEMQSAHSKAPADWASFSPVSLYLFVYNYLSVYLYI